MSTAILSVTRFCTTCQADVAFEQPECLDEHGLDCPEWVCVECGDAVLIGMVLAEPRTQVRATRHVA
jgi:hypothetical protein